MKQQFIFCLIGAALGVPSIGVTESPTNSVSLESLVAEALEKNPELRFYRAEIDAAKGERKQAGTFPNPELNTEIGRKRVSGSGLSAEGMAWSVSLMQPFEWPGRMGLRKAIANRDIHLAELGYERFRVALTSRVRNLAYQLFAAQEKAKAATEVAERFQALREILVQRDPAGLTPLLETRIIEATELTAQRKASDAMVAAESALIELNQLRGQPPTAPLSVTNADITFPVLTNAADLLTAARTNNFELRLRAVELAQQGFRVALARNERYPSLAIGPAYSEERAGERERIIGVGISMPVPLWNKNAGAIQTAKARQLQAEVSYAVTQREIERQIAQAAATYIAKTRQMGKWRPDSIPHFKEAAELADRHYRLGAVPIATYVELQEKYLEAVEGLLDTKKEALEAAQNLQLLTGAPLTVSNTSEKGDPNENNPK